MTKYLGKKNTERRIDFGLQTRVQFIPVGRSWLHVPEAAGHMASSIKQCSSHFLLLLSLGFQPTNDATHLECVFPPPLTQSMESLTHRFRS